MKALITRKVGMSSIISEDGSLVPVTLLSVQPNVVTQLKTVEKDGYNAVQLGTETMSKLGKAIAGHLKASEAACKVIREFRIEDHQEDLALGNTLTAEVFSVGDEVKVTGTSKGKGWAGTIKRHNFHRQRKTHGGKGNTRKVGSIGSMYPQRIFKGKKMAGQYGATRVTTSGLKVALVDTDMNVIGVVGAVPGPKKSIVLVRGVN